MKSRTWYVVLGLLALASPSAHSAQPAGAFPQRPIRMILPFAPGGTTEAIARVIAQKMGESLGQQVVVDNRPGAGGSLGTAMAAKAASDGYTLLLTSLSPIVINPTMYASKAQYDPQKDFVPISSIIKVPSVIASHQGGSIRSIKQLIAFAKANPGKLSYGSSGAGGVNHLIAELFRVAAGIELLHIDPEPQSVETTYDRIIYTFNVPDPTRPAAPPSLTALPCETAMRAASSRST